MFLVGEHQRFVLQGRIYELVIPLLDGRRTLAELIDALADSASPADGYYAVTQLEQHGYLEHASIAVSAEAAAFWSALGVDPAQACERLATTAVAVVATRGEDPGPLTESLTAAGVVVRADAALRVVVTGDYLDSALDGLNRQARDAQRSWIPVRPAGVTAWIGPMFRPAGPCWECLAARLRINRPVETFLAHRLHRAAPIAAPRAAIPASERAARELAALTVARWIVDGQRGEVDQGLLTLDFRTSRVDRHILQRRPQCPVCGDPDLLTKRAAQPIVLEARPKRFTQDGGYRCMAPEETFARYEHLVSPIAGVVSSIGPVPQRDHPLRPVYAAGFFVRPPSDPTWSSDELSRTSMGKGRTAAQSKAGALCEAIERYSAVLQGDEPRVRSLLSALGDAAVHPHELLNFSAVQYQQRTQLNAGLHDRRKEIPLPFDERVAIDWTPAWSLASGRRRYVPTAYCYLGVSGPPEQRFCEFNSNGHAAGNCLEEAILQAFLELVERDAVAIWWYNRTRRPQVDLAQLADPYFAALEAHYRTLGYRVWVLDITTDLEIPAFVALARSLEHDRWCIGFGCHVDAVLAVQRALTELNQLFEPAGTTRAPWSSMEDESFLLACGDPVSLRIYDDKTVRDDLRAEVEACVQRAARRGLDVLVVDQSRPDIGLCAVKVMVPGLRHFWPRFGPGRLYDVPVQLGWLDRSRTPEQLNPVPLYL